MAAEFDPYHKWLGILPKDQPPNYYRLLGLEVFEEDLQVIEASADRQSGFLRKYQSGELASHCQKLLNEIARARLCLLKPSTKAVYDAQLREQLRGPQLSIDLKTDADAREATAAPKRQLLPLAIGGGAVLLCLIVGWLLLSPSRQKDLPRNSVAAVEASGGVKSDVAPRSDSPAVDPVAKAFQGVTPPGGVVRKSPGVLKEPIEIQPLLKSEHIMMGKWKITPQRLESLGFEPRQQVLLPIEPPEEYHLHLEGTRLETPDAKSNTLAVGLVRGAQSFVFGTEVFVDSGTSGVEQLDDRSWRDNETTLPGFHTKINRPFQLDATVRKDGVEVRIDGRLVLDWQGDWSRLKRNDYWSLVGPQQLFLGAESKYVFTRIRIGPPLPRPPLPGKNLKPGETVELLDFVDVPRDAYRGTWLNERPGLKSDPGVEAVRVRVPYQTPEEYELLADVECYQPGHEFYLGLPVQQGHAGVILGAFGGEVSGMYLDRRGYHEIPDVTLRRRVLPPERFQVTSTVRKNHVVVKVGDETVFNWRGDARRLMMSPIWAVPGNRVVVGSWLAGYRIRSLKLKRLGSAPPIFPVPSTPQAGNLLPIVHLDRDTAVGNWTARNGRLTSLTSAICSLRIPATLPPDYDFRMITERKSGNDVLEFTLPVNGHPVTLAIDSGGGKVAGIEWYEGRRVNDNSVCVRYEAAKLPPGRPHLISGRVRGKHLLVEINGDKLFDLDIPEKLPDPGWDLRPGWLTPEERLQPFLATYYSSFEIQDLRYRSVDAGSPPFPEVDLERLSQSTAPTNNPTGVPGSNPDPNRPLVANGLLATGVTPIPEDSARQAALTKIRMIYGDEQSKAKRDTEKLTLAAKLEQLADSSTDDPAVKYVSLDEARKLAAEAGDLEKSWTLSETMGLEFRVDVLELKATTLKSVTSKLKGPVVNREMITKALPLVDQLLQAERFDLAVDLSSAAAQAAVKVKDKGVTSDVSEVRKEAEELAREFAVADKARDSLRSSPDDAAARLAWGRWLCFRKSNWPEGLKTLQGAGDATLKDLATRDLQEPAEATAILKLGSDWLEFAKSKRDHSQAEFADRAVFWLSKAHAGASGLSQSKIESQLEEAVSVRDWNSPLIGLLDQISKKVAQNKFSQSAETRHQEGTPFQEVLKSGGVLIGFNCMISNWYQYTVIKGLQPVYATKLGLKTGEWRGLPHGQLVEIRARPGYAVVGTSCQVGAALDNVQVMFARMTRTGLDPQRIYLSGLVGAPNRDPNRSDVATSGTQPIIGIFGHADDYIRGLGLVISK